MTTSPRIRLAAVGVVVLSLFAAMFTRLWYLQVLDSTSFVEAATANQVRFIYEEAPRGRVLDRNGKVLVDNRRSPTVTVEREAVDKAPKVKARLAALLGTDLPTLQRRIDDPRFSPYRPIPVAQDVSNEIVVYLAEHADDFVGVQAEILAQRRYPQGALGAHLLGYVGEINDKELQSRRDDGYRLGDTVGKSGVELVFESDLRGEPGITKLQVDARGRVQGQPLGRQEPVRGDDVYLSIDSTIQGLAEESLALALEAARGTIDRDTKKAFVAPAGSVVVLDPNDGSVLAMASHPSYNPSDFVNGIRQSVFDDLQDPKNHFPLNNRAITGLYSPGSTFKLITALAALTQGMIIPSSSLTDTGVYTVPNCRGERCTFQNAGRRAFGRVDLRRSMVVSSDVYFYSLGARYWIERDKYGDGIQDMAKAFGFGSRTGIPFDTDRAGLVPDPDLKKRRHEENPKAFPEGKWYTGDNINIAIGQGDVLATPLQMANAYATFANGGTLYEPRIGLKVTGQDGTVVREIGARPRNRVSIPPAIRNPLLQGLTGAVSASEGTASAAFAGFDAFPVAGKTGTAQVTGKQDSAVFVAFAPADSPRYVISVILEEAGFGGTTAAPVARRILAGIAKGAADPLVLGAGTE